MRTHHLIPAVAFLVSAFLSAQTPAAPQRPAATRPDPNSPANIGRTQLTNYLDDIAAKETAARRETVAAITTRAQAEARQREVRKKILTLIGGLPEKTPLSAKVLDSTQADGFRIEKILFESQPNFPVTALLYLPDAKPAANPAPHNKNSPPSSSRPVTASLAKPPTTPSPAPSRATASPFSPTTQLARANASNTPTPPIPTKPSSKPLPASTAKPASSPPSSATPPPASSSGTASAPSIIFSRAPKSTPTASEPSAAPAVAP